MLEKTTINKLKTSLLKKRDHLEKELNKIAIKNNAGNWKTNFDDQARDDEINANEVEEFTNNASVVATLSKDLKNINIALSKISAGNAYGKCESCNGEITIKRLKIFPEAKNCMKCKQQL